MDAALYGASTALLRQQSREYLGDLKELRQAPSWLFAWPFCLG